MRPLSDLRPHYPEFLILLGEARRLSTAPAEEISEAIDRLKQGSFGDCEECDSAIPLERLRRFPFARLCITCQVAQNRAMRVSAATA